MSCRAQCRQEPPRHLPTFSQPTLPDRYAECLLCGDWITAVEFLGGTCWKLATNCPVCGRTALATCALCARSACGFCDKCRGCMQVVCAGCDTAPTAPFEFAGDQWMHPHNAAPVQAHAPGEEEK